MEYIEHQCFPIRNTSCSLDFHLNYVNVFFFLYMSTISVLTVCGNLLVIISITVFKQLHTPTNLLILSLAVSDFLVGICVMPVESVRSINSCFYMGKSHCRIYHIILSIFVSVSLVNIILVALDRYFAVCDPLLYMSKMTVRKTLICISLGWTGSIVYNLVPMNFGHLTLTGTTVVCLRECAVSFSNAFGLADLILSFIAPCIVILTLYVRILAVALRQAKSISKFAKKRVSQKNLKSSRKSEVKATKTLSTIVFVYFICWVPWYIGLVTHSVISIMSGSSGVDANLLAHNISSNIQRITLLTNEIQQLMRHFGTAQDTTILRQTLQEKQQNVNHLAKVTDKYMKDFSALPVTPEQRQRKIQRERLITEFSNALGVFQKVQREVAKKEKEFVERVRASSRVSAGDPNDGFGGIASPFKSFEIQAQTQSYEENFTEEDLQLIQERESAIRQLESDITNINDIFRDLGMMVHEQGDMIDSIEANVSTAEVHVQSATQNLNRAASYQTSFRKKIFIFIAILVVVAVIIGLIVWASQKQ